MRVFTFVLLACLVVPQESYSRPEMSPRTKGRWAVCVAGLLVVGLGSLVFVAGGKNEKEHQRQTEAEAGSLFSEFHPTASQYVIPEGLTTEREIAEDFGSYLTDVLARDDLDAFLDLAKKESVVGNDYIAFHDWFKELRGRVAKGWKGRKLTVTELPPSAYYVSTKGMKNIALSDRPYIQMFSVGYTIDGDRSGPLITVRVALLLHHEPQFGISRSQFEIDLPQKAQ